MERDRAKIGLGVLGINLIKVDFLTTDFIILAFRDGDFEDDCRREGDCEVLESRLIGERRFVELLCERGFEPRDLLRFWSFTLKIIKFFLIIFCWQFFKI